VITRRRRVMKVSWVVCLTYLKSRNTENNANFPLSSEWSDVQKPKPLRLRGLRPLTDPVTRGFAFDRPQELYKWLVNKILLCIKVTGYIQHNLKLNFYKKNIIYTCTRHTSHKLTIIQWVPSMIIWDSQWSQTIPTEMAMGRWVIFREDKDTPILWYM